eukprot:TRINITY_DN19981_c0_g1_i1.p1 TRINITY_DN19981_c0_g1~~TRINITY_DN19981_c0_g1_i1.p1  ORF type:complete len:798 (+),score=135.90 TRINITY_DN19981_c0_g1_i1:107-2500(+)
MGSLSSREKLEDVLQRSFGLACNGEDSEKEHYSSVGVADDAGLGGKVDALALSKLLHFTPEELLRLQDHWKGLKELHTKDVMWTFVMNADNQASLGGCEVNQNIGSALCELIAEDEVLNFPVCAQILSTLARGTVEEQLTFLFCLLDSDGTGWLLHNDIGILVDMYNWRSDIKTQQRRNRIFQQLLAVLDANDDGKIHYMDFIENCVFVSEQLGIFEEVATPVKKTSCTASSAVMSTTPASTRGSQASVGRTSAGRTSVGRTSIGRRENEFNKRIRHSIHISKQHRMSIGIKSPSTMGSTLADDACIFDEEESSEFITTDGDHRSSVAVSLGPLTGSAVTLSSSAAPPSPHIKIGKRKSLVQFEFPNETSTEDMSSASASLPPESPTTFIGRTDSCSTFAIDAIDRRYSVGVFTDYFSPSRRKSSEARHATRTDSITSLMSIVEDPVMPGSMPSFSSPPEGTVKVDPPSPTASVVSTFEVDAIPSFEDMMRRASKQPSMSSLHHLGSKKPSVKRRARLQKKTKSGVPRRSTEVDDDMRELYSTWEATVVTSEDCRSTPSHSILTPGTMVSLEKDSYGLASPSPLVLPVGPPPVPPALAVKQVIIMERTLDASCAAVLLCACVGEYKYTPRASLPVPPLIPISISMPSPDVQPTKPEEASGRGVVVINGESFEQTTETDGDSEDDDPPMLLPPMESYVLSEEEKRSSKNSLNPLSPVSSAFLELSDEELNCPPRFSPTARPPMAIDTSLQGPTRSYSLDDSYRSDVSSSSIATKASVLQKNNTSPMLPPPRLPWGEKR